MKAEKAIGMMVLIKGVLMILIGIIHTIAIYFEYQKAIKNIDASWAASHAVWFGMTGMFFLFIGVMDLLSHAGLQKCLRCSWRYAFCSALFPALLTPIGIYIFRKDADFPLFPVIIFAINLMAVIMLISCRGRYRKSNS